MYLFRNITSIDRRTSTTCPVYSCKIVEIDFFSTNSGDSFVPTGSSPNTFSLIGIIILCGFINLQVYHHLPTHQKLPVQNLLQRPLLMSISNTSFFHLCQNLMKKIGVHLTFEVMICSFCDIYASNIISRYFIKESRTFNFF